MTDNTHPEALRLADMLTADEWPGHVTLVSYARECVAELRRQHARITEMEAQLEAIGAGGVSGPLMGEQSAPKVSDAQRALHELILNRLSHADLLEKAHYLMELNSNQGRTIGELQDLAALTAQAPSQLGGFSAGDMASAAAQGYRDGWTAAQAISAESAGAMSEQEIVNQFDFLEGLVNEYTFRMIVDAAKNIQADALASHGQALAQPGQAGERDYRQGYEQRDAEVRGALV